MENLFFEKSVVGEIKLSYSKQKIMTNTKITNSKDLEQCIREIFPKEQINYREHAYLILLNRANLVLGYYLLSIGGITGTVIDLKVVFQCALLASAEAIALCHNHPSSNLTPSKADYEITKKITKAGKFLDITVLDHIIITENEYYSFADHGDL
ncbi:MAG: DNA repair protein [Flavobacteriaceae bacterium]|nr:MAG: DNA repair protein [Flavobacteriaceae bacterium]